MFPCLIGSIVTFKYDPFGRRIEKAVNGQITRYFYDSEDILFEYDGSGVVGNRYIHGPGKVSVPCRGPVSSSAASLPLELHGIF